MSKHRTRAAFVAGSLLLPVVALFTACAAEHTDEHSASGKPLEIAPESGEQRAKRAFEIGDLYHLVGVGAPAVSPDGKKIAVAVRHQDLDTGKSWSEIWLLSSAGNDARLLTAGRHNDADPAFSPDGKSLLFTSDREGGAQFWLLPLDGGEARQLTHFGPGLSDPVYSPDGRWIAATAELFPEAGLDEAAQARITKGLDEGKTKAHVADDLLYRHWTSWHDGKRSHVLLVDASSGAIARDLTPGSFDTPIFELGGGRGYAFAPDSREICVVSSHEAKQAETTNADLWTVSLADDKSAPVNLTGANAGWDGLPLYSPDGRWIAFVSQATAAYESDLKRLALYDRRSKSVRYLTTRSSFDDQINDLRWRPTSGVIVFEADHRGRTPLYEIGIDGGTPRELLRHGTIGGFEIAPDGSVVYARRTVNEPLELFALDKAQATPRRLTTFNEKIEHEVDLRPSQEMWVKGEGGYDIHTFVVTPHDFDPKQKYPLILNVHGGPQSQWSDSFRGDWQVYPGKGYIVAFANPTGSTGYGQDFCDAISRDWGGRVYRDLMRVADALEQLPYVDAKRIGLMGWSYGGYMSQWIEGHTDRFACNASMMGLFDLRAEYGATEELWFPEHDLGGTPWTSDDYEKWSPCNFVKNFKTPALVVTGELDYRVPYTQSLAYFTALQKMGVPSRLVVLPKSGHWPAWHEMALYYNAHLEFFQHWLGGGAAPWDTVQQSRNLAFGALAK